MIIDNPENLSGLPQNERERRITGASGEKTGLRNDLKSYGEAGFPLFLREASIDKAVAIQGFGLAALRLQCFADAAAKVCSPL